MLVRALIVLRFYEQARNPHETPPRQPLISRAMKAGLMAEDKPIGNDEPPEPAPRLSGNAALMSKFVAWSRTTMADFSQLLSSLTGFARPRHLALFAVLATAALARVGPGDLWLAALALVVSNVAYAYGESMTA